MLSAGDGLVASCEGKENADHGPPLFRESAAHFLFTRCLDRALALQVSRPLERQASLLPSRCARSVTHRSFLPFSLFPSPSSLFPLPSSLFLPSKYEALLAYRRSLPGAPRLARRDVTARGLRFAVYSTPEHAGTATPPLVCVNGGMLYSHAMLWPALSPLAAGRRLIFYDQRGRGESEEPSDPLAARIEHDAEDLLALRQALGLREWDVLGHSWGAGIALLAAERDREGVRRLVLVDSVGPTSEWISGLHERALERLSIADRSALERLDPKSLIDPDPALHSAYSRAIYPAWFTDPRLAHAFNLPRALSRTGSAVLARLRREGYNWTRLARAVRAPTLVLHGERDLILCATSHELTSLVVSARLELVPDCGHMPFWEAPETFFALVSAFVATP